MAARRVWGTTRAKQKGYELVDRSDREFSAPGTGWLEELIGESPALILIDEIARQRGGSGPPTGNGSAHEHGIARITDVENFQAEAAAGQVSMVAPHGDTLRSPLASPATDAGAVGGVANVEHGEAGFVESDIGIVADNLDIAGATAEPIRTGPPALTQRAHAGVVCMRRDHPESEANE